MTTKQSDQSPCLGMGCKLELLTLRDPLLISGGEGRDIKLRKPSGWNRKATAPRASLQSGPRTHSLFLAGPAKRRFRQAAPLCVLTHPHTKEALSGLPGFPISSLQPQRLGRVGGGKETGYYVYRWEAAGVIKIECTRLRVEIDDCASS